MWASPVLVFLVPFLAGVGGSLVDAVNVGGECTSTTCGEREDIAEADAAIMIQSKATMQPDDRSDWWLTQLENSRKRGESGDAGSGLADLIDSELQAVTAEDAAGKQSKGAADSKKGAASVLNVLKLIKSEVAATSENQSVESVAPAPYPPPAPPPESSLVKTNSTGNTTAPFNYSNSLAASSSVTDAPSPPPYSVGSTIDNSSIVMIKPNKNLTAAEKQARKKALLNCIVENWSDWGPCETEGHGENLHTPLTTRKRVVVNFAAGGNPCPLPITESEACKTEYTGLGE